MTRALVVRLDSAGDVLLAGPAVRAVAAGAEQVCMLVSSRGRAAAELLPGVDRVLVWDSPWVLNPAPPVRFDSVMQLTREVAECRADVAVVLTSFHQSPLPTALLLRLAGVQRIVGASVDYAGALLDVRLRPGEDLDEDQPEPERALAIAAAAGFALPAGDDGRLAVRRSSGATSLSVPTARGQRPYVVLHPGADAPSRTWPAEHFAAAARMLRRRGVRVVVTGAPSEAALTASVAGSWAIDLGGRTSLAELAEVLAGAACVVVGNTGPAHLAAAVRTPVVSLFSPVVPAVQWAPYRTVVRRFGDQQAPCAGTRARECPVAGHPCLADVTPAAVVQACLELLEHGEHAAEPTMTGSTATGSMTESTDPEEVRCSA